MYNAFALAGLALTLAISVTAIIRNKKENKGPGRIFLWLGEFINKYYLLFLFAIFAVFLVSRILKLDSFPNGFHVDELSMAVDAKSILFTGKDRSGVNYPPYFQNYGGGQNALYIYIQAFLFRFLPFTIFGFRIQAVFWGAVCFFALFGICFELTQSKGYSLMGPLLATVLPVYIMSERWGLEANLFLPFSTIVMYLAIRSVKSGKWYDWAACGLTMGVSLYTYAVSYIVWPIFLILTGLYLIRIKKLTIRNVVVFAVPLVILALPLILFQLVNFGILAPFSLGISDYFPLPISREEEVGLSNIWESLMFTKKLLLGGEALTYNSFAEFGTVYMFLIPFILIGLIISIRETVCSFRNKTFSIEALIVFYWFAYTVFMLIVKGPNVNRMNGIFMSFLLFICIAVFRLFSRNPLTLTWLFTWSVASFVFFMYFYFFVQNSVYGLHPLHTSSASAKAIVKSEQSYLRDENTHIYVQFEDLALAPYQQVFLFASEPDEIYSDDNPSYGNVTAKLPDELDVNENAVYIIGEQWPHIVSYLISEGFEADQTIPGVSILYRLDAPSFSTSLE